MIDSLLTFKFFSYSSNEVPLSSSAQGNTRLENKCIDNIQNKESFL